jgi:hypothetical protein
MESMSLSPDHNRVAAAAGARGGLFQEPASPVAVMWEQMEFLLDHAGAHCSSECLECTRLEQLKQCLLRPFGYDKAISNQGPDIH